MKSQGPKNSHRASKRGSSLGNYVYMPPAMRGASQLSIVAYIKHYKARLGLPDLQSSAVLDAVALRLLEAGSKVIGRDLKLAASFQLQNREIQCEIQVPIDEELQSGTF